MNFIKNKTTNLITTFKRVIASKTNTDVRFRLIDVSNDKTIIWVQCIHTNTIFYKEISGTTIELDIIGKLLPEQACFWGILLGEYLKIRGEGSSYSNMTLLQNDFFLYAKETDNHCKSITFDRFGNVIFTHPKTKLICSQQASAIVADRTLINSFHPTMACFIGLHVGHKNTIKNSNSNKITKGNLRLISSS